MSQLWTPDQQNKIILPDGGLIIDGLPAELRVVPNAQDGQPDWVGRWFTWRDLTLKYRTAWRAELTANPREWPAEIERCRTYGTGYFTTLHLNIWEPQPGQRLGFGALPFIPMPFQIRVWDFLDERFAAASRGEFAHGLIDKPRGVGATYAVDAWVFTGLKFRSPWDVGMMSRTEDDVDKKERKGTLFGKLDVFYASLDPHLQFKGFRPHRHRTHMFFMNPETGAQCFGEATTTGALRGDRGTVGIGDEAAFWENLLDIGGTLMGATPMFIWVSNLSDEVSRDFSEMVENFQELYPDAILSIGTEERPDRQEGWQEKTSRGYAVLGQVGQDAYEREHLKQSEVGIFKYIYPEAMDVPYTGEPINPRVKTIVGIDPGRDDEFAITLWQERGELAVGLDPPPIDLVWGWTDKGHDADFIASLLVGQPLSGPNGYYYEDKDLMLAEIMRRLGSVVYYGCTGGDQRGPKESWYKEIDLAAQKQVKRRIVIQTSYDTKDRRLPGKREAFRALLRRTRCLDHPVPRMVVKAFREHQYQKRPRTRPGITEAWQDQHDWTAHLAETGEVVAVHLRQLNDVAAAQAHQKSSYASPHGIDKGPSMVGVIPRM